MSSAPRARTLLGVGLIVFVLGLTGLGARATYGARVSADEPQYLLTAISLAEDRDLDISDEIAARRYRPFHEVLLDPQTIQLNGSGQELSPHDPLLPLLLAVPVGLAGWVGAKVFLALVAGATAAATLQLAVARFGVPVGVGVTVVVGCFAAPPFSVYATQVYPEMTAALCTVVALSGVLAEPWSRRWSWAAVVALAALPWLGVKYVPVAAVIGFAALVRVVARRRPDGPASGGGRLAPPLRLGAQVAGLVVAALAYLVIHRRVYGGWTVYAAGDEFTGGELGVVGRSPDYIGRSRRLIGLIVDRGFGLAAWNPVWLALVPAVVVAARRRSARSVALLATLAVGWATATWVALTMHGWWWPGRQTVVVLPLGVVVLAHAAAGSVVRLRALVLACAVATLTWWWVAWEASTGRRTVIVDFEQTSAPWYRLWRHLLPDHRRMSGLDVALTVIWLAALGAWAAAAATVSPGSRRDDGATPTGRQARLPTAPAAPSPGSLWLRPHRPRWREDRRPATARRPREPEYP